MKYEYLYRSIYTSIEVKEVKITDVIIIGDKKEFLWKNRYGKNAYSKIRDSDNFEGYWQKGSIVSNVKHTNRQGSFFETQEEAIEDLRVHIDSRIEFLKEKLEVREASKLVFKKRYY